jgi:hypothetical protein
LGVELKVPLRAAGTMSEALGPLEWR